MKQMSKLLVLCLLSSVLLACQKQAEQANLSEVASTQSSDVQTASSNV